MFGIGGFEFLLILLFAFLVFGPDKLPEIARTAGELIARFRQAKEEMDTVVRSELNGKDQTSSSSQASSRRRNVSAKPAPGSASHASSAQPEEGGASDDSSSEDLSSRVVKAVDDVAASARESAHEQRVAASQATETFAERKARYERERQEANRRAMKEEAANAVHAEPNLPSAAELYGNVPLAAKPRPAHSADSTDSSKGAE